VKFKCSRELLDLRKQEKTYFSIKDYDKAEKLKKIADKMEAKEREEAEE